MLTFLQICAKYSKKEVNKVNNSMDISYITDSPVINSAKAGDKESIDILLMVTEIERFSNPAKYRKIKDAVKKLLES